MSATKTTEDVAGQYADVNGLKLYYEIHGAGQPLGHGEGHGEISASTGLGKVSPWPLLLLHGGVGAIEMFGEVLPILAKGRQVIAVDLQAHGRTADIDRPLSIEAMADDIGALVGQLGLKQVDVMGYSMGGAVAIQTAIRHPDLVRKLVAVSVPVRRSGWYPEMVAGMSQMGPQAAEPMKQTPMYELYARIAPRPEDWPVFLTKLGDMLRKDYDWSKDFAAITAPALIVVGDADGVRTSHAVEMFELLGGGKADGGWDGSGMSRAQLAILPGMTHYTIFSSPILASTVMPFLDAPMPKAK